MKIIYYIFLVIILIVSIPLNIAYFFTFIFPELIIDSINSDFQIILTKLSEKIRAKVLLFDSNGLKHNIKHIDSLTYSEFHKISSKEKLSYADFDTYKKVQFSQFNLVLHAIEYDLRNVYSINITKLANLYFLAQHHPDIKVKTKLFDMYNNFIQTNA